MRKLRLETEVHGVPLVIHGTAHSVPRCQPKEVEIDDALVGGVSVLPLLSTSMFQILNERLLEEAVNDFQYAQEEFASMLREERRLEGV